MLRAALKNSKKFLRGILREGQNIPHCAHSCLDLHQNESQIPWNDPE